jgi:curved DNA-binding protein CbpA
MSELQYALELFGFSNVDDVTSETLKVAFKTKALTIHPDKGGDAEEFDKMLAGYVYLTDTLRRITGGRHTLQNITSPGELKERRPDELINRLYEEHNNEEFNKEFEKNHKASGHGYEEWLKSGDAVVMPTISEKDLNKVFEETVKKGKPEPSSIILHPDEMAYYSGGGTEIIESHDATYTSNIFTKPEYTDVYAAYNSDNTVYDKLTPFAESNKTIDELINERTNEITPFTDLELKAIQDFEKTKIEAQTKHLEKIKQFFDSDRKGDFTLKSSDDFIIQIQDFEKAKHLEKIKQGF